MRNVKNEALILKWSTWTNCLAYSPKSHQICVSKASKSKGSFKNDVTQFGNFLDQPLPIVTLFITKALVLSHKILDSLPLRLWPLSQIRPVAKSFSACLRLFEIGDILLVLTQVWSKINESSYVKITISLSGNRWVTLIM